MRWWLAVILTFLPAAAIAQPVSTVEADQTIDLVRQGQIELLRQELRTKRAMAIVNANSLSSRPRIPPMKSTGMNTAASESVMDKIVNPISRPPFSAASIGVSPRSM